MVRKTPFFPVGRGRCVRAVYMQEPACPQVGENLGKTGILGKRGASGLAGNLAP